MSYMKLSNHSLSTKAELVLGKPNRGKNNQSKIIIILTRFGKYVTSNSTDLVQA